MFLGGKFLKPISSWGFVHREIFEEGFKSQITFIQAPAGFLLTESLAAILAQGDRKVIWVRFGWEDFDPGTCLLSLIESFRITCEEAGTETFRKMRKLPGPLQGWQVLFAHLGYEISECMSEPAILILENLQHPAHSPLTLAMLINHFLPSLPSQMRVILISRKNLPGYSLPKDLETVKPQDLKLSSTVLKRMFQPMELISDKECIKQAVHLMNGSPVGLVGIYRAGQLLGEEYVQDVLQHHTTRDGLYNQIARDWLSTLDEQDIRAMATLLILGYNNPVINQSQTGKRALPPSPWSQELDKGWIRIHRFWLNGVKAALRTNPSFNELSIQTVAYYLCQSGFYVPGIELLLASKAFSPAAEYLAEKVDNLLTLGQWDLLNYWMDHLPETILQSQPRLLHASGEIKSASGDLLGATKDFQLAKDQYIRRNDNAGEVNSLLALSTLATHLDDAGEVWTSAYQALQIAQSTTKPELESNAELQVGILALQAGDVQNAVQHLERAADLARTVGDVNLLNRIDSLHSLAVEHEQQQQKRKQQYQVYLTAQQAELAHLERMQQVIRLPLDQDAPDWGSRGWLDTPMMLKLGSAVLTNGHVLNGKESLWNKISNWLHRGLENGNYQKTDEDTDEAYSSLENGDIENLVSSISKEKDSLSLENGLIPELSDESNALFPTLAKGIQQLESPITIQNTGPYPFQSTNSVTPNSLQNSPELLTQLSPISNTQQEIPSLVVYCLGPFLVYLDDKPVIDWPSSKGKSIFQYLVTHRERPIVKEILMDLFWPEATPDAARNNLNVAIYGLRQALRKVQPSFSHLLFQDDAYLFNPNLKIWLDYEAFTELLNIARSLERDGNLDGALYKYCAAEAMYHGEFMEEERYEEWPIPQRQHLQNEFLNLLDRLIRYYFDRNDYLACSTLCHKMLTIDPCREDSHRYLMRCFLRQGHPHLALRQYHLCEKMLKEELDITPTSETTSLYEQIRNAEPT